MAKNPPSSEKEIFRKNYDKFCNVLKHEDGLLPHLVEKGIISWDDLDEIKSKNTSEKGPTLLKHISGPLDIDHTQGFYGLLEIMINHGKVDTQEFARKIKYECLSNRGFDDAMPTFDDFSTLLLNCDFSKWTKIADCLNVHEVTQSNISEKLVGDELRDKKAFLSVLSSWREKAPVRKEDKKATWRNLRNSLAEFDDIVEQIEKIKAGWSNDGDIDLCDCKKPLALRIKGDQQRSLFKICSQPREKQCKNNHFTWANNLLHSKVSNKGPLSDVQQIGLPTTTGESSFTIEREAMVNFTDCENIDECFSHFTAAMFKILSQAEFPLLRRACLENSNRLGGIPLPKDLKDNIMASQSLNDLFDVLCNSPYWNWMNIKMLVKMTRASHLDAASKLIQQYRDEVYSRKVMDVLQQIPKLKVSDKYYTRAKEKWNKSLDDVTVNDLVNHWSKVEQIFDVEEPTVLLNHIMDGCVEVNWLIPTESVECICQSIQTKIFMLSECDILCFDIGDHSYKCSSTVQLDKPITATTVHEIVIPKVSNEWIKIALLMNFELSEVQNIKKKCGDDPKKCCTEVFEKWLLAGRKWENLSPILKEVLDSETFENIKGIFENIEKADVAMVMSQSRETSSFQQMMAPHVQLPKAHTKPRALDKVEIMIKSNPSLTLKDVSTSEEKPRLNHLNRIFIEKYATKWKDIAAQLGISTEDIEIIEVDSPSTQECCRVMLLVWLQRDLKASWKRLHDVLKDLHVLMECVDNKSYPATDPEWKHGKKIDHLLKNFPVVAFSFVPDSRKGESGEQSKVVIRFSYLDYDIFEISKCDKNVTKLLCIEKQNGTKFEKIFSKILSNEKFKYIDNLKTEVEMSDSTVYLLFIRPVGFEVKYHPEIELTPILTSMLKLGCQDVMDYFDKLKTSTTKIDTNSSATYDVKENPVKKRSYRKMYHVSNKPDLPDSNHPDWNEIKVAEARYEQYHGNILLGLPVAGFTIAPLGKSIYPFEGATGKKYYQVQAPFDPRSFHIFNMGRINDQIHLLCIRNEDIIFEMLRWLLEELSDNEFRSYFVEEYRKEDLCKKSIGAAINVYFIENISIKGETWDSVEKEEYNFGPMQTANPYLIHNNQQLLDAWIEQQTQRVVQEFIQCFNAL